MIQKGTTIRTIQWPHQETNWYVVTVLWPNSAIPIAACIHPDTGANVNLILSKCYKPTGNFKVDLIQQIKCGSKKAYAMYIKVYKQVPKYKPL